MTSIKDLSDRISSNTAIVDTWLASTNAKALSFDQDADEEFPATAGNTEVERARLALLEDSSALHDLLLGSGEALRRLCWGAVDNAVQQCIYHFGFLNAIPLEGGATYKDLSTKVGLTELQTKAIVRQSAMNRVFREDGPDHVVHTAASALVVRNRAMLDWYGHTVEEVFPSSAKLATALEKYRGSSATQDCAFGLAFDTKDTIYKYFEDRPANQARFFGAMEGVGKDPGHDLQHIVNGYSWAKLKNATVVDVGGSSGFVSAALAKAYPNLTKLVVQDYKNTVEQGAAQLPTELSDRVQFQAHDFFQPQPTAGADVYIMRHICHNWPIETSAKILQQIVPVMKPSSKILLVEVVVMPSHVDQESIEAERYMRNVDVTMLQMLNTQERDEAEWRKLVEFTSPELELTGIFRPKGSWDSMIEISLKQN